MKAMLLVGAIGLALGGGVGYHMVYAPQREQARVIGQHAAQEQADQQARQSMATLLQDIEQYRKRTAPEPEASWLARHVLALGHDAGLELSTISQALPQHTPQYIRLAVNLQFAATYHELGTFLDAIERSTYFIRVDRLDISSGQEQGHKASVQLMVSAIYVPPLMGQVGAASKGRP